MKRVFSLLIVIIIFCILVDGLGYRRRRRGCKCQRRRCHKCQCQKCQICHSYAPSPCHCPPPCPPPRIHHCPPHPPPRICHPLPCHPPSCPPPLPPARCYPPPCPLHPPPKICHPPPCIPPPCPPHPPPAICYPPPCPPPPPPRICHPPPCLPPPCPPPPLPVICRPPPCPPHPPPKICRPPPCPPPPPQYCPPAPKITCPYLPPPIICASCPPPCPPPLPPAICPAPVPIICARYTHQRCTTNCNLCDHNEYHKYDGQLSLLSSTLLSSKLPPAQNDCCGLCYDSCYFRNENRLPVEAKTEQAVDPYCNSQPLRRILKNNIYENITSSKRRIQKAATEQLKANFNVICSRAEFSYLVNTELFCQETINDITCYIFRQLLYK